MTYNVNIRFNVNKRRTLVFCEKNSRQHSSEKVPTQLTTEQYRTASEKQLRAVKDVQ